MTTTRKARLTKTEERILESLAASRSNRYTAQTARELAAARKLVDRGLVRVVHVHHGVVYSNHGIGRHSYSRPHYYSDCTIAANGRD